MNSDIQYVGSEALKGKAVAPSAEQRIKRAEPIIRADVVSYILFNKADLQLQKRFLVDFGMTVAKETSDSLYMRGVGPSPYFYVAYEHAAQKKKHGPAARKGFIGLGFGVKTEGELRALSESTKIPIDAVDGPGGGKRVRLHDPDGFIVDVTWGREEQARLPGRDQPVVANTPFEKPRINATIRTPIQPSAIERLGHCVLSVSDFNASLHWYMKHLGLIPTDVQCLEDGTPALSFNRLDRGAEPADHHSLVLMQNIAPQYMHSAYETLDIDSIGQGQQYLRSRGWKHFWGMGRHILGSQIFDYWLDPEGDEVEHYADGDVFDATRETQYHPLELGGLWAWGDDVPDLAPKMNLSQIVAIVKALRSGKLTPQKLGLIKKAMTSKARPWIKR